MSYVLFFTKPGCLTGGKQMEILRQSGHEIEVRSILEHPWSAEELCSYFGDLPVSGWFNPNAPRVKSGAVDPAAHDRESALAAMLADHLLIRRPLLQVENRKMCGFDLQRLNDWIGLAPAFVEENPDLQSCSARAKDCTP